EAETFPLSGAEPGRGFSVGARYTGFVDAADLDEPAGKADDVLSVNGGPDPVQVLRGDHSALPFRSCLLVRWVFPQIRRYCGFSSTQAQGCPSGGSVRGADTRANNKSCRYARHVLRSEEHTSELQSRENLVC